MKLRELLSKYENMDIVDRIVELYPAQRAMDYEYHNALTKMRHLKDIKDVDVDILITEQSPSFDGGKTYVVVTGIPSYITTEENVLYSMEYVPWSTWLSMTIHPKTIKDFKELDILIRCILQMTYHGMNQNNVLEKYRALTSTEVKKLSSHKEKCMTFWTEFIKSARNEDVKYLSNKRPPASYDLAIGAGKDGLLYTLAVNDSKVTVELSIRSKARMYYQELLKYRIEIEKKLGFITAWSPSRIREPIFNASYNILDNSSDWPRIFKNMRDNLHHFKSVFSPYIKNLK